MSKMQIEIDDKYKEALDLLKQVIPSSDGSAITDDGAMVEALIDSFMAFLQEQAGEHNNEEEGESCGGGSCGCSH